LGKKVHIDKEVTAGMKSPFADILLRLYWCFPSIIRNLSYDYTEPFLRFYWNGEPSTNL